MKEWLWSHAKMLIGIFISTLALKSGGLIGRLFGTLGLAWISYQYVMPEIRDYMSGLFSALNPEVYDLVTYVKVDQAVTLILSAGAVKLTSKLMLGKAGGSSG
jgi:hypothetical protein